MARCDERKAFVTVYYGGMTKKLSPGAQRFRDHLARARELRRQVIEADGLAPEQHTLSDWQTRRLASTYGDFRTLRRYQPALEFFLTDLYGTQDFAQRDADIARVYPLMVRVLSENALQSMSLAVELHALTQELDSEMIAAFRADGLDIGANPGLLDQASYARAYRRCDNRAQRERQIVLIGETGQLLDEVVRHPMINFSVRLMRGPAHAAGFGELQSFIERGIRSFRQMKGADKFLGAIQYRETRILEQILGGGEFTDWSAAGFPGSPAP